MSPSTLKELRKRPLYPDRSACAVRYLREDIERILPHRPPLLLVDSIEGVDLERKAIWGTLALRGDDPVFAGHFPGSPVYPGVLQVEAMGQLGLCMAHFLTHETVEVPRDVTPVAVRALKIHHAQYLAPIGPGDVVEIHAAILAEDGMTATSAGQLIKAGSIVSFAVQEVYFVE